MFDFNLTNEEIVAKNSTLTVLPIPCRELENLLGFAGLAKHNAVTGAWEGSLIDVMSDPPIGLEALAEGLEELFSHLNKPRSTGVDTFEQPWASKMDELLGGLQLAGLVDSQFVEDVLALAGGLAYPDLDVNKVQEIRESEAAVQASIENEEKYKALYNAHISPLMLNPTATSDDWQHGLDTMANEWGN